MRTLLVAIAFLSAGFLGGYYYRMAFDYRLHRQANRTDNPLQVEPVDAAELARAAQQGVSQAETPPSGSAESDAKQAILDTSHFTEIYTRLGLQNSDTIREINGVRVPDGFAGLENAYRSGSVCVSYLRAEQARKVCLSRDPGGSDRINDTALN